eukprot:gb/GECG01003841.1/.p1 GENE.gb/GECG01003841.1/~~gb/GECG01003841.1/.p1  ORF type:complete len:1982 (+),score=214.21 gb/GECG01003841.1/:1-5946(+)
MASRESNSSHPRPPVTTAQRDTTRNISPVVNVVNLVWYQRCCGGCPPRTPAALPPHASFADPNCPMFRERHRKHLVQAIDSTQQRQYDTVMEEARERPGNTGRRRRVGQRRRHNGGRQTRQRRTARAQGGDTTQETEQRTGDTATTEEDAGGDDEEDMDDLEDSPLPQKLSLERIEQVVNICFSSLRVLEEFVKSPDLNIQKGIRKAALALQKVFAQKMTDEDVNNLTTHFSSLRGPAFILESLNKIDWILQNVTQLEPDKVILLCGTASDLLTLLRELSFLRKIINHRWMYHHKILSLIVSFLRYPDVFDSAVICLEEAVAACGPHGVPRFLELDEFRQIIESLEPRRLAKICRVLALLIFEPEVHDIDDPLPALDVLNRWRREQLEEQKGAIPPCAWKALNNERYVGLSGKRKSSKDSKNTQKTPVANTRDRYQEDRKKKGGNDELYIRRIIQENQRGLLMQENLLSRLVSMLRLRPRFSGCEEGESAEPSMIDQFLDQFTPSYGDDLHALINTMVTQLADDGRDVADSQREALNIVAEISGCSAEIAASDVSSSWEVASEYHKPIQCSSKEGALNLAGLFRHPAFIRPGPTGAHASAAPLADRDHRKVIEANVLVPGIFEEFPPLSYNNRRNISEHTKQHPRPPGEMCGLPSCFYESLSYGRPIEDQEELLFRPSSDLVRTARIHELNICISILCALDSSDRDAVIRKILRVVCCNDSKGTSLSLLVTGLLSGSRGRGPMGYTNWRRTGQYKALRRLLALVGTEYNVQNTADVAEAVGLAPVKDLCGYFVPSRLHRTRVNLIDCSEQDNAKHTSREQQLPVVDLKETVQLPATESEGWHQAYRLRHLLATVGAGTIDYTELVNERNFRLCSAFGMTSHSLHSAKSLSTFAFSHRRNSRELLGSCQPWLLMEQLFNREQYEQADKREEDSLDSFEGSEISCDEKAIFSVSDCAPMLRNTTISASTRGSERRAIDESEDARHRFEHQIDRRLRRLHFRSQMREANTEGDTFVKLDEGLQSPSGRNRFSRIPAEESAFDSDYESDEETDGRRRVGLRGVQLRGDPLSQDRNRSHTFSLSYIFRRLCPDGPYGVKEAIRILNEVLESAIAAHQVEVIVTLCGLLNSRNRKTLQDCLADYGIMQATTTLLKHTSFSWTEKPADWEPPRLHGESCTCDPESSNKIQVLRLLHSIVDRGESRTALERWITRRRAFSVEELAFFEMEEHQVSEWHTKLLDCASQMFRSLSTNVTSRLLESMSQHLNRPCFDQSLALSIRTERGKRMAVDSALAVFLEILLRPWELSHDTREAYDGEASFSTRDLTDTGGPAPPRTTRALSVPVGYGAHGVLPLSSNPLVTFFANRPGLWEESLDELLESNLGPGALSLDKDSLDVANMAYDKGLPRQSPGSMPQPAVNQPLRSVYCPLVTSADCGLDLSCHDVTDDKLSESITVLSQFANLCKSERDIPNGDNIAQALLHYDCDSYRQSGLDAEASVASQALSLLVGCSFKSPYRFWLSSCIESLLRNSPVSVRKWAARYGLLKYLMRSIEYLDMRRRSRHRGKSENENLENGDASAYVSSGFSVFDEFLDSRSLDPDTEQGGDVNNSSPHGHSSCSPDKNLELRTFQSAFDLLAETVKMNPCALEDVDIGLNKLSKVEVNRFLRTLCQRPVDSTVFLRSILLTMHWCRLQDSTSTETPQLFSVSTGIPLVRDMVNTFSNNGRWAHEVYNAQPTAKAEDFPQWTTFTVPIAGTSHELPQTYNARGEFIVDVEQLEPAVSRLPPANGQRLFQSEICSFLHFWAVPMLMNVMDVIHDVESINQENICCLNTAILHFIIAHKQGKLPMFVQQLQTYASSAYPPVPFTKAWYNSLDRTDSEHGTPSEEVEDKRETLQSFCNLLEFWLQYYAARWKDRPTLALTTGFPYLECRETVMILLGKHEEFIEEISNEFNEELNALKRAQCCVEKGISHQFCSQLSSNYLQRSRLC